MCACVCVCVCVCVLSHLVVSRSLQPQWAVAHQTQLFMGLSSQEYWRGLLFPPPEDLPDPGIEPSSPALQVDSLPPSLWGSPSLFQVYGDAVSF